MSRRIYRYLNYITFPTHLPGGVRENAKVFIGGNNSKQTYTIITKIHTLPRNDRYKKSI